MTYMRKFVILEERNIGHLKEKPVKGYAKIEVRDSKGKILLNIEGFKHKHDPDKAYKGYLLSKKSGRLHNVEVGNIIVNESGKGSVEWKFNPQDIDGKGLTMEDFNLIIVRLTTKVGHDGEVKIPLAGYIHSKDDSMNYLIKELEREAQNKKIKKLEETKEPDIEEPKTIDNLEKIEEVKGMEGLEAVEESQEIEEVVKEIESEVELTEDNTNEGEKDIEIKNIDYKTIEQEIEEEIQEDIGQELEENFVEAEYKVEEIEDEEVIIEEDDYEEVQSLDIEDEELEIQDSEELNIEEDEEIIIEEDNYEEDIKIENQEVIEETEQNEQIEEVQEVQEDTIVEADDEVREEIIQDSKEDKEEIKEEEGNNYLKIEDDIEDYFIKSQESDESQEIEPNTYQHSNLGYTYRPRQEENYGHSINTNYNYETMKNYSNQMTNYAMNILKFFEKVQPFEQPLEGYTWWEIEHDSKNVYRGFLPFYNYLVNAYYPYPGSAKSANCQGLIKKYKHYLFGTITENDDIQYYVYGIPGKFTRSEQPMNGATGFKSWLPIKGNTGDSLGYWLIYIDPITGKVVNPLNPVTPPSQ